MENEEKDSTLNSKKSGRSYLLLLLSVGALAVLFGRSAVNNYLNPAPQNQDINNVLPSDMRVDMQPIVKSSSLEKIAVISVVGVIGDPGLKDKIIAELRSSSQNADVKAVILRVESPGGGVQDTSLIYREILKFKGSKKPLVAFFDGIAASGGYYISAPADKIIATPETITGSIGVIIQFPNYSELMGKLGVKMHTIKSGAQKDMLSPYRPMDPEGEKILQDWINESYDVFVSVVSTGRKIDEPTVRQLADGRIYSAKQAVKNHLIDSTGYFEDAVALAKELSKSPNASVVEMNAVDTSVNGMIGSFMSRFKSKESRLEKILVPLTGLNYLAPGFEEKYLK